MAVFTDAKVRSHSSEVVSLVHVMVNPPRRLTPSDRGRGAVSGRKGVPFSEAPCGDTRHLWKLPFRCTSKDTYNPHRLLGNTCQFRSWGSNEEWPAVTEGGGQGAFGGEAPLDDTVRSTALSGVVSRVRPWAAT